MMWAGGFQMHHEYAAHLPWLMEAPRCTHPKRVEDVLTAVQVYDTGGAQLFCCLPRGVGLKVSYSSELTPWQWLPLSQMFC